MISSKLVSVLRTFSKEEIKEFRKFVDSPFFNKEGKYVLRFYDEIKKYYPDFTSNSLERSILFNKLYPGKEYNDSVIRKISSALQKLTEEYLNYNVFKSSGYLKELLNLKMFREKRLINHFELRSAELDNSFNNTEEKIDIEYFRNRYKLELEKINYYMDFHSLIKQQQESMQNIQKYIVYDSLINLLDIGYNLLVGLTSMYSGKANMVMQFLEIVDLESVSKMLKKESPDFFPIFELFYVRYKSFQNFKDEDYTKYKKLAMKNIHYFDKENRFTIMVSLQNFCIRKFVSGQKHFAAELHGIHKEMLAKGLIINDKNGFMNMNSFRNIILTAQTVGKYSWMEKFINEHEKNLIPEQRESLSAWARASVDYDKKEFESALRKLLKVKNDHFLTKHDIKILMMKIFYELKDFETALSFADTYRHMVENDKTYADVHRNSHRSFAVFYSRFIKLIANENTKELPFLKNEIEKSVTNSKDWLLLKISEKIK
jgi:hypothetical protein